MAAGFLAATAAATVPVAASAVTSRRISLGGPGWGLVIIIRLGVGLGTPAGVLAVTAGRVQTGSLFGQAADDNFFHQVGRQILHKVLRSLPFLLALFQLLAEVCYLPLVVADILTQRLDGGAGMVLGFLLFLQQVAILRLRQGVVIVALFECGGQFADLVT